MKKETNFTVLLLFSSFLKHFSSWTWGNIFPLGPTVLKNCLKTLKKCFTTLIIKMQSKQDIISQHRDWQTSKWTKTTSAGADAGRKGLSLTAGGNVDFATILEIIWTIIKIDPSYDLEIQILG